MVNNRGIYIVKMKLVPMVDWVLSSYIESPYQAWLKLDMKGVLLEYVYELIVCFFLTS